MKANDLYRFPAVFTYEDGCEIAVTFPDLGTSTCGADEEEAFRMAKELLGITILGLEDDHEPVPAPSPLSSVVCEANERTAVIEVYMPAIRNAAKNRSVNRTVTLPAWLNSAALERGINFSQVLQDALKEQLASQ